MTKKVGKAIHFHFHPRDFENGNHTLEKAEGERGKKRKYLCGVSSGIKVDSHGERMTEKCIKSFMDQASSGDVLLFPDVHGIKESDDIGILVKAEILPTGDWYTEYRLYDEGDKIGTAKAERIDTLWKQMNGLPPYKKARQKGFSIEGIIPDESIMMDQYGQMDRSVIDDISLDGAVLVPRPAYKDSIATAIYKALGETTPFRVESIQGALRNRVQEQEVKDAYYKHKWDYQDAMEEVLERIMTKPNTNKRQELEILFDEYKNLMLELILNSEGMFAKPQEALAIIDVAGVADDQPNVASAIEDVEDNSKLELFKSLYSELNRFANLMEAK